MLALCLMLLVTYYAFNYIGMIILGLHTTHIKHKILLASRFTLYQGVLVTPGIKYPQTFCSKNLCL